MFSKIFGPPDLSLTTEEVELRRKLQQRVAIIAAGCLFFLAAGIFLARPVVHAIHGWQARRHATKAFALIDQQQWGPARDEAIAAYRLRSSEPQAIRAVARLFSRAGHPDALKFWRELGATEKLSRIDLRDEAAIALKIRDLAVADEAVKQLLSADLGKPEPADWLLAAQLEVSKQDLDRAVEHIRQILNGTAASERDRFQGTLLLDQIFDLKQTSDRSEIIERLSKFASGSGDVGIDALVSLAQRVMSGKTTATQTGFSIDDLVRRLEQHPASKPQHKLLAIDLKMLDPAADRDALMLDGIAQFKNGDPAALLALATWLNGHGQYQSELDAIPEARSLQNRDLFFQHVDALGALGRWDEIRRLIESEKFPLDPVIEHMYLARCFSQLGQANGAENNWRRALEAAAGDPGKLVTLAEYAEKNQALDIGAAAYEAAANVAPGARQIQQSRLRVAYAQLDTQKIYLVLTDLLKHWPHDTAVQNDEAYVRLLLPGASSPADLTAIADLAENLVKREPFSLPHRTLLALARLKQNRVSDALAVYQDIKVAPGSLTSSALAVHVAVLIAAGHEEDARTERAQLKPETLLPEERALLDGH